MATEEPPESPVVTAWKSALASFRKSIPKKDFEQIQQSTSPEDVLHYIESVQLKEQANQDPKFVLAVKACAVRLQRFSGALDMLAQGAAGPGCLVWGSIKLALMIVSGNFEESERLLRALVLIGDCVPRVEIYTNTFLNSSIVQTHIHGLYVTILHFWARAIKFYKRRKLWKLVRSSWYDYDVEFGNLEATLHRHQDGLEKAAIAQHLSDYNADNAEQKKVSRAIVTANTAMAHKEIVRWLTPAEYEAEYYMEDLEHARKLRHPGTCEWICTQPVFQNWSESTTPSRESLLWIHAIPGAGKTVLSSFLIDHPGFWPSCMVFYFLFKSTDVDKNSITAAARSLLYQLYKSRRSVDAALVNDIETHLNNSGQSHAKNFKSIWTLFCAYAANVTDLVIVIDALDECIEPSFLIRGLQKLSKDSAIKIVVTSRREKELVEDLRDWMSIEMGSKEVAADIAAFLEYKVSKSPKLSHPLIRSSVLKLLQSRSKGMFLWVALMIKDLKSKVSIYEIQDALLALPEGLDRMYERILRRLHTSLKASPKELCLRVLRWVVCATRPLKMQELEEALKLEYTEDTRLFGFDQALLYTERDIELACGSLLTLRSGTVQLIHLSAKEFLQDPSIRRNIDDALRQYLVDVPSISLQITSHCVSYLLSRCSTQEMLPADDVRLYKYNVDKLKQDFPLLEYACFNWVKHFINVIEIPTDEDGKTMQSFFESQCCLIWIEVCFNLDPGCSFRLRADINELLDWTNSYSDGSEPSKSTQSVFINVMREWAGDFQKFITDYGTILQAHPSEVHFTDPERIFESLQSSSFRPTVAYDRHIVLNDPETFRDLTPIPGKYRLHQSTGEENRLGFFYRDQHRDVFYTIDEYSQKPRIFIQECSTGRRLPPLNDPELDDEHSIYGYGLEGACMSPDGHHLAATYLCDSSTYEPIDSMHLYYTAVWTIAKTFNFDVGHRTSTWGKKLFSSTVKGPSFMDSLRAVMFALDGSLCCPAGQVSFSTGEVRPLSTENLDEFCSQVSWLEDGKSLITHCEDEIVLVTLEGEILRTFTLSGGSQKINCYSSRGEFVVYSSILTCDRIMILQDIHTGITQELDIPTIPSGNFCSFTYFDKDKLLGIVCYGEKEYEKTNIFVWTGMPLKPHLWATKELAYNTVGHFFDEQSHYLYVVGPGRIWGRISLESSALMGQDLHIADQAHMNPARVEYCISRNGKKLAVLKCWKQRASIRVLDLNRPEETFLSSSLDLPTGDIDQAKIFFSPDVELLLVNNLLYHLNCSNQVNTLVPTIMPDPIVECQNNAFEPQSCFFSSCHNYIAVFSSPCKDDDRMPVTLHVYHVSLPSGEISKVNISLGQLEIFTGIKIAGININFHPDKPKLGVVYWPVTLGEPNPSRLPVQCLVLDLRSMGLERVQPSSPEEIPLVPAVDMLSAGGLVFSDCGHYIQVWYASQAFQECCFSLGSSRTEPNLLCNKPLIITPSPSPSMFRNCFFNISIKVHMPYIWVHMECGVEDEAHEGTQFERKNLTTVPAHLHQANIALLLGEDEDSNIRVVFWQGHDLLEIKYLNLTWRDFMSRFSNDFSTKLPAFRK